MGRNHFTDRWLHRQWLHRQWLYRQMTSPTDDFTDNDFTDNDFTDNDFTDKLKRSKDWYIIHSEKIFCRLSHFRWSDPPHKNISNSGYIKWVRKVFINNSIQINNFYLHLFLKYQKIKNFYNVWEKIFQLKYRFAKILTL